MQATTAPEDFLCLRTHATDDGVQSRLERIALADLSAGEVTIRVRHAGVNYKDCVAILGRAKIIERFPRIAGIEAVGDVLASEDPRFAPGQSVMVHGFRTGIAFDGGFAEVMRVPAAHVMAVPQALPPLQAALLGVPAFTVGMALERFGHAGLTPDAGMVAVSGASGAVGMLAIAILAQNGWRVAALTRKAAQADALRALGAAEVLDAAVVDAAPRALEKARFAAAIDNVGGATLSWLLRSTQPGGCVASVGNASGNAYDGSVLPFIMRGVQLVGIVANAPWPARERIWGRLAGAWRPDFERLAPHVQQIALDALPGHALAQVSGQTSGRTLASFAPPF